MRPEVGTLSFEELPGNPEGDISADEEAYERADYARNQAQDAAEMPVPPMKSLNLPKPLKLPKLPKAACEKQRCQEGKQPVYNGCHAYTQHEVLAVRFGYFRPVNRVIDLGNDIPVLLEQALEVALAELHVHSRIGHATRRQRIPARRWRSAACTWRGRRIRHREVAPDNPLEVLVALRWRPGKPAGWRLVALRWRRIPTLWCGRLDISAVGGLRRRAPYIASFIPCASVAWSS